MAEKVTRSNPAARVKPKCGYCNSHEFSWRGTTFGPTDGVLVYCKRCGAVVGWGPNIDESRK
jgi:hypothetical protein